MDCCQVERYLCITCFLEHVLGLCYKSKISFNSNFEKLTERYTLWSNLEGTSKVEEQVILCLTFQLHMGDCVKHFETNLNVSHEAQSSIYFQHYFICLISIFTPGFC